jgi:hypothetical protein
MAGACTLLFFFPLRSIVGFLLTSALIVIVVQGKTVDDLAWAIMHEFTKLVYRVSEIDVTRAKNQVRPCFQRSSGSSIGLSAQLYYERLVEEAGEAVSNWQPALKVCSVLQSIRT